ncbi:hypothetical protein KZZ52_39095 [Dactylosporangium sp. AC04546]|uniref:hypothetical protein n=1 Tax=Dactylosporangium sp. AC04546 TaxID=2862460 RepID=UPI001EDE4187|nr:hypothetical protein [Dactylosporangium sp. AC04546]WVK79957.1 hypothetical protein KZZ52_39095 [Dactylosporangium sp. AC04546]
MMHTLDELRRALADEAAGRTTRTTFADVRRAARRRRRAVLGGLAALLAATVAAGTAAALTTAGPSPSPAPSTATPRLGGPVSLEPFESLPPGGPAVETGIRFGAEEELILWYQDQVNGVLAGVRHVATGKVRRLDSGAGVPQAGRFGMLLELDDRNGGVVDYGAFGAGDVVVKVTAGGRTMTATTVPVPGVTGLTIFWSRRTGALVGPTGSTDAPPDLAVTAADARTGDLLDTAERPQRSDGVLNQLDAARPIGERIRTGLLSPERGELVFWFEGDDRSALLQAGFLGGTGGPAWVRTLLSLSRPPTEIGFYGGRNEFDLGDGGQVWVGVYSGRATTVEMGGEAGPAVRHGSGTWSAHPRMRVFWGVGVPGLPRGVSYDAAGNVLGTTDFTQPGGG